MTETIPQFLTLVLIEPLISAGLYVNLPNSDCRRVKPKKQVVESKLMCPDEFSEM